MMKKLVSIVSLITFCIILLPSELNAQAIEESDTAYSGVGSTSDAATVGNYAIKFGPMGNIYIIDRDTELDPGIGGFLAFDYRFHANLSAEIGGSFAWQDGTGISAGDNNIFLIGAPTFDLKYYFLTSSRWDPYALLGFGLFILTEGSNNNGSTAFGIGSNLGLGVDYYITEHVSVGVSAIFRAIALIQSFSGDHSGSALFPFSMIGSIGYHF